VGGCVWGGCVWGEGGCRGRGCLRTSAAMPWAGRLRVVTAECACAATGAAALRMPRADLSAAVSLGLCSVALGWSFGAASFIDEGLLSRSTSYGVCPCSARYVGKAAQETALGSLRWLRPTSEQSGAGEGRHICTGTFWAHPSYIYLDWAHPLPRLHRDSPKPPPSPTPTGEASMWLGTSEGAGYSQSVRTPRLAAAR
jgi:hypothetical protein